MVQYKCDTCFKVFTKKSTYERHINRKNPCTFAENIDSKIKIHTCKKCNKTFNRKDHFIRHYKTCTGINSNNQKNIKNGRDIINSQIINGDNSKIIIKQYNLFPFSKDGTDCLSIPEKIAIFSSDENPMEMIIVKMNLDVNKPNHHNVGIPDLQSGYGIIFDGDKWITERINVIMEVMLDSKEKDLIKIHNEIKEFLSDDVNESIKDTLNDLNHKLNRGNHIDVKSKKTLIAHLKKHFYNNRNLALEAKKHTNKKLSVNNNNNKFKNILREGCTIEDIENHIKNKKQLETKINVLRDLCIHLLNKSYNQNNIDKKNYNLLLNRINELGDVTLLNTIINKLINSICYNTLLTNKIIDEYLSLAEEMNHFCF